MSVETPSHSVPELLRAIEDGVAGVISTDAWRRYLSAQSLFHHYSPGNVLLILNQRPDATIVAGFRRWQRLGRQVRLGEHGIAILAPVFGRKPNEREEAGSDLAWPGPVGFRVAHVFDVSQTEGEPLPEVPAPEDLVGDSREARLIVARITQLAVDSGVRVVRSDGPLRPGAKGMYDAAASRIVLRPGLAMDQAAKTLVHEMAHHLLGHGRGCDKPREVQEVEAESVAYVVCSRMGLDTSDYSFAYLAGWAAADGGTALVRGVQAAVQRVSSRLIDTLEVSSREEPTYRPERVATGITRC